MIKSAKSDEGFTLIEVLVALTVLVIISTAFVPALVGLISGSGDAQYRSMATNLAQQDLSQERAIADRTQVAATTNQLRTVGGRTFTLSRTVSGTCTANYTYGYTPAYIDVTTTVTWPNATSPVVVATRLAC